MTSISAELFHSLGYSLKDEAKILIRGINGESEGISSVVDYFEIGGVNLGNVRIAVGKFLPEFEDTVILGVNVLMWYDFAVSHSNGSITLVERRFAQMPLSKEKRFTLKNPAAIGLPIDV
jgi:predicted aspartyl protease